MKRGRPAKLRLKKTFTRKRGAISKGAKSPKQIAATLGRRQVRRTKVRKGVK